ncbi:MAG: malectin domain-containing carbohydrate-binding protein [Bacteroidales bacterium]|jgi:beta-galactosidase|nr:malectin domain-containing carbohydrate-binding protein [Bacteroidales bacterium]
MNRSIIIFLLVAFTNVYSQTLELNTGWQFKLDRGTLCFDWQTVNLPHTWNDKDAFDDEQGYFRGLGIYQKLIFLDDEKSELIHYLKFNGVNQYAQVYLNGKFVGEHKGGYTAFSFNITPYLSFNEYNLIEVKVDNSHNDNIPPLDADFTFYGGIYRTVQLISVPKQHISKSDFASDGYSIDYDYVDNKKVRVTLTVNVNNLSDFKSSNFLKIILNDADKNKLIVHTEKLELLPNNQKKLKIKLDEIQNPKLWSPESPYLYNLEISLLDNSENILETNYSSVGFRWFNLDAEKGFFLNGKPYKLIGVNRHQDYEGFGNAVPIELQKQDIHLIKNMGANFIRFAHYPHSRELYDLCDRLGILVWSEIPIVNKVSNSKEYFETCLNMQKEHIKQYYNFPSVVMFGYMNEIFLRLAFDNKLSESERENTKKTSVILAQKLESLTRKLAPNRLTVMALHFNEMYNETGIADIPMLIGWNLYFGWYHDKINDLGSFLDDQHQRFPNRSIMVSEYGSGADTRIFTTTPKKYDFSLDYQFLLHKGYYNQVTKRDYVVGMAAWNFADFGSEFRGDAIPHVNQKGLVQYNREPKDIYYFYKANLFKDQPFIHIGTSNLRGLSLVNQDTYPVKIYSNQAEIEVFLNDEILSKTSVNNGFVIINFPFTNGSNDIFVKSGQISTQSTIDVHKTDNFQAMKINDRIGINIGAHFNFYDTENQITWLPDRVFTQGLYGHKNGEVYLANKDNHQGIPNNIKNTTAEPLYQTMLMACTDYKVDVPNGKYKIALFFVEPKIKSKDQNLYNLNSYNQSKDSHSKDRRIMDIIANGQLFIKNLNLAEEFPDKYGVKNSFEIDIRNNTGLEIRLKPIEGEIVISGILIEKIQ